MRKLLLSTTLFFASLGLFAEGFQVNLQSTKQTGMGHTGTAMKLGAEGMHFNPASLIYIDKMDFSVGGSAVISNVDYTSTTGSKATTDNSPGTPLFLYAGFSVIKDRLAVGLSLTTPYGSSIDWGDNWAGSSLVQNIALKSYFVQPTVSVKIVDGLSFGAGLTLAAGSFELSRGLLPAGALAAVDPAFAGVVPLSANLEGKSSLRVGYNLGLMYEICDQWSVGLNYRSKIEMKVDEGEATLTYYNKKAEQILANNPAVPPINNASFNSALPLPANLTLGVAFKPIDRLTFAFDVQYTFWSAYEKLDVIFNEDILKNYNITADKKYENTFAFRVGGEYEISNKFDVRAGIYYDQTPVQSTHYNPETPGANKIGISAGLSYTPLEDFSIDFAFLYINGKDTYGEYPVGPNTMFSGNYKSTAYVPSLGLSYRF